MPWQKSHRHTGSLTQLDYHRLARKARLAFLPCPGFETIQFRQPGTTYYRKHAVSSCLSELHSDYGDSNPPRQPGTGKTGQAERVVAEEPMEGYYAGENCKILRRPQPKLAIQDLAKTVLIE